MRDCAFHVFRSVQHKLTFPARQLTFELFGLDFMINADKQVPHSSNAPSFCRRQYCHCALPSRPLLGSSSALWMHLTAVLEAAVSVVMAVVEEARQTIHPEQRPDH